MSGPVQLLIEDKNGETHVLLDPAGDHIVVKHVVAKNGSEASIPLGLDTFEGERALRRAARGAAFL